MHNLSGKMSRMAKRRIFDDDKHAQFVTFSIYLFAICCSLASIVKTGDLSFNAQPEAPAASHSAGASGWALNEFGIFRLWVQESLVLH